MFGLRVLRQCRLAVWAVLALVVTAPAVAGVFNPEVFTLANGMQVVVIPNHRIPAVTHMVWYKIGAADEAAGKSGIAHFLEHLMFKGTENAPGGTFSELVARNGGRENAFTTQDATGYYQSVAVDRLEVMMRLEADRMINLAITEEEVETERGVVLEERRARIDNDPEELLEEQVRAALYLNHPYGRPIIGWEHEIENLSAADARDFYRRYYAPNNAILVVAGDITAAQLRPLAEKYYGVIPAREIPPRIRPQEPVQYAHRRVVLTSAQVRQPAWSRRFLAPSYTAGVSEHAYALEVLAELLGGGTTSRLYRALVVERKLATVAGAIYSPDRLDLSSFVLYGRPRPDTDVAELEAAMEAEIARLIEHGVGTEEVERAKKRLQAEAVYARDSLQAGARILGRALAVGRTVEDVEAWPERIAAVTVDQVNAAARAVLRADHAVTGVLLPEESGPEGRR